MRVSWLVEDEAVTQSTARWNDLVQLSIQDQSSIHHTGTGNASGETTTVQGRDTVGDEQDIKTLLGKYWN